MLSLYQNSFFKKKKHVAFFPPQWTPEMPLDIFSWFRNYLLDIHPANEESKFFYKWTQHEANIKIKVLWKHSLVFLKFIV